MSRNLPKSQHPIRWLIHDTVGIVILIVIWILFNFNFFIDNPVNRRGWFRGDISISLPYTGAGTIPTFPLVLFSFAFPLVCLIISWSFVDKLCCNNFKYNTVETTNDVELFTSIEYKDQTLKQRQCSDFNPLSATNDGIITTFSLNTLLPVTTMTQSSSRAASTPPYFNSSVNTSSVEQYSTLHSQQNDNLIKRIITNPRNWPHYYTSDSTPRSRKIKYALYQFYVFVIVIIFTILITTSLKYTVGRLRPDFLSRCKPDYSHPDLVIGVNGWIDPEYEFICQGDKDQITGGRESFPSGHSSSSLCASTFVSLLIWSKKNYLQRKFGFLIPHFFIMCSMLGGLLIATSRSWDNRHHFFDIFTGCTIGVVCGLMSLLFPYMWQPMWELDGTLFSKENSTESDSSPNNSQNRLQNDQNPSSSVPASPIEDVNNDTFNRPESSMNTNSQQYLNPGVPSSPPGAHTRVELESIAQESSGEILQ